MIYLTKIISVLSELGFDTVPTEINSRKLKPLNEDELKLLEHTSKRSQSPIFEKSHKLEPLSPRTETKSNHKTEKKMEAIRKKLEPLDIPKHEIVDNPQISPEKRTPLETNTRSLEVTQNNMRKSLSPIQRPTIKSNTPSPNKSGSPKLDPIQIENRTNSYFTGYGSTVASETEKSEEQTEN